MLRGLLQLTKKCNQDCPYCCRDKSLEVDSLQKLKRKIKEFDSQTEKIIITGGEPTLYKELPEVIRCSAKKARIVHLQSNGIKLADLEYCKTLVKSGLNSVLIALPSFNESVSDHLTTTTGTLSKKIRGVENFSIFKDVRLGVVFVPVRSNYKELPDYVRRIAQISRDIDIQINFPMPFIKKELMEKMVVRYKEFLPYLQEALSIVKQVNMQYYADGIPNCQMPQDQRNKFKPGDFEFIQEFIGTKKARFDISNEKGRGLVKLDLCRRCRKNDVCRGIYGYYVKMFGKNELNPVN